MKKGERKRKKKKERERSEHSTSQKIRSEKLKERHVSRRNDGTRTVLPRPVTCGGEVNLSRGDGGRLVGDSLLLCQLADTRPGRTQSGSPHVVRSARGASGGQAGILRELGSVTERRWHCEIGCTR